MLFQKPERDLVGRENMYLWTNANRSADPSKLQGTHSFAFELHIPSHVSRPGPAGLASERMRPPPSFTLNTTPNDIEPSGTEWASCRYFLKVTLGRRGLLKSNERWMVPVVYVSRQHEPPVSDARMLAQAAGQLIPGPLEDPGGWAGKQIEHPVKRGLFARGPAKQARYEAELLLPTPAQFARTSTIPFALRLTSTDPDLTTRFPPGSISIRVVQRAHVSAQGVSATHYLDVGQQADLIEDGPEDGVRIEQGGDATQEDGPVWGKRFRGQIRLSESVGASFTVPNLTVSFLVTVHITCPGSGNDSKVFFPVEILSSLRAGSSQAGALAVAPTPARCLTSAGFSASGAPAPLPPAVSGSDGLVHTNDPSTLDAVRGVSAPIVMAHADRPPPTWAESVAPQPPGVLPPDYLEGEDSRVDEEGAVSDTIECRTVADV